MTMFPSRYTPCFECGASVPRHEHALHACDPERQLDYRLFHLRDEIERFESELRAWLSTARGRFEVWYASRRR